FGQNKIIYSIVFLKYIGNKNEIKEARLWQFYLRQFCGRPSLHLRRAKAHSQYIIRCRKQLL
ncbi:MAG: hypothetical protein PUH11_07810, partial [Bacilli bacterium]|nr:hypothetical protein [Bacilli bacterium]